MEIIKFYRMDISKIEESCVYLGDSEYGYSESRILFLDGERVECNLTPKEIIEKSKKNTGSFLELIIRRSGYQSENYYRDDPTTYENKRTYVNLNSIKEITKF